MRRGMWLFFGLVWLAFAATAAMIADLRGGPGGLGFILGFLLGPFGLIAAFYLGDEQSREQALIESGRRKPCPACAELVKPEAKVCRYCGHDFTALHLRRADAA